MVALAGIAKTIAKTTIKSKFFFITNLYFNNTMNGLIIQPILKMMPQAECE
jgi:hypothetical protein